MYPEDRVLVAYVPHPADFKRIQSEGWYRIPQKHVPKGLHAEYIAFYFGSRFGQQKWAIHYYAPNLGHELMRRVDLIPAEPVHPCADSVYYKIQLGELETLPTPIMSLRWRRVTFIHTTWDRFQDATEINDLFIEGDPYVDRLYAVLKERGIQAERNYAVKESGDVYHVPLAVPCQNGRITLTTDQLPQSEQAVLSLADQIVRETAVKGGICQDPATI